MKGLIKITEKFRAEKTLCTFLSPSIPLMRGTWNIDCENNCAHLKVKGSFHSAMQFWFMISEKKYHKVHISSPLCMHAPKVSSRQSKLPLDALVVFIDMNTTCIYLQKESGVSKHY